MRVGCLSLLMVIPFVAFAQDSHAEFNRSYYAGISVTVHPETTSYSEGQDIILTMTIDCDHPSVIPWTWVSDYADCIWLERDDLPGQRIRRSGTTITECFPTNSRPKPAVRHIERSILFNEDWCSPSTRDSGDFPHLEPGHYTGHFKCVESCPPFHFVINPVPPKYASEWEAYKCLRVYFGYRGVRKSAETQLDSARAIGDRFVQQPLGNPYRTEVMATVLSMFEFYRAKWGEGDSLRVRKYVETRMFEEPNLPKSAPMFAEVTLFKDLSSKPKIAGLKKLAREFHNANFTKGTKEIIREIREREKLDRTWERHQRTR
jgi:hypothetical protein